MEKIQFITEYENLCKIIETATLEGDYKSNNIAGRKILKMYDELAKDILVAKPILKKILKSDNIVTKIYGAVDCLKLNIYIKNAIKTLNDVSQNKKNGIFSFNADMCLKVYNNEIPGKKL